MRIKRKRQTIPIMNNITHIIIIIIPASNRDRVFITWPHMWRVLSTSCLRREPPAADRRLFVKVSSIYLELELDFVIVVCVLDC